MSDIGINYDAYTQPSQVGVRFGLRFENTTLRATVRNVDSFIVRLTPAGNVSEMVLSGVAWPLAQTIGAILPQLANQIIGGQSFDVVTINPSTQNVGGENITVKPGQLSLSNYKGMMMVQGTIDIS